MSHTALRSNRALVVAIIMLATFMVAIEATIVATAMPKIVGQLGGFTYYSWVFSAFLLAQSTTTVIYGKLSEVSIEDMRRVFETNFWGLVYGSLEAARHLKERGGAIINIGSTLSDRAIPMQGIYSASKHAVKGFTDALRMELESDGAPISVTLVKPGAIDTPYTEHAKNYMAVEPKNPPPLYAPETVARAILHCAETPERDVFVGAGGKGISLLGRFAPRLTDKIMEKTMIKQQQSNRPAGVRQEHGLYRSSGELQERGGYVGHVAESSLYTRASLYTLYSLGQRWWERD